MQSTRQNKICRLIQQDMSDIFLREMKPVLGPSLISVTEVRITPDLSIARIYVSIMPIGGGTPDSVMALIRENTSENEAYKEGIDALRARIDVIDENLLKLLKDRMGVSQAIGQYKKEHNVAILQAGRWEQVMNDAIAKGKALGLSEECVSAIMNAIHEESVKVQKL